MLEDNKKFNVIGKRSEEDKLSYILQIGPKGKGGIDTVIKSIINSGLKGKYKFKRINTIIEKRKIIPYVFSYIQCRTMTADIELAHIHMASNGSCMRKGILINYFYKKSIPVIIHLHGGGFQKFYEKSSDTKKKKIAKMFQKSAQLIVLTNDWLPFAEKIGMEKKTTIIPNFTRIPNIAKKKIEKDHRWTFLFLGKLGRQKGSYDLIRAIELIINRYDIKNIKCILAGNGEIDHSKKLIRELGLEDNLELTGWVDFQRKDQLLRLADTLVLPSYFESFGLALIEGMSYGLPVIGTIAGSIPQVVRNGKDGFLIPVGDIATLADRMVWLINHPVESYQMGVCGRKHVMDDYSEETFCLKMDSVYSKILNRGIK